MALTNWNDILNKPSGIKEAASLAEDVEELQGDVAEIALEISQLSASTLPYSSEDTIKEKIDDVALNLSAGIIGSGEKIIDKLTSDTLPVGASIWFCQSADDSPDVGNVGAVLIIKATGNGLYSRLYAFVGGSLYSAQTASSIPASLTWTKISTT